MPITSFIDPRHRSGPRLGLASIDQSWTLPNLSKRRIGAPHALARGPRDSASDVNVALRPASRPALLGAPIPRSNADLACSQFAVVATAKSALRGGLLARPASSAEAHRWSSRGRTNALREERESGGVGRRCETRTSPKRGQFSAQGGAISQAYGFQASRSCLLEGATPIRRHLRRPVHGLMIRNRPRAQNY